MHSFFTLPLSPKCFHNQPRELLNRQSCVADNDDMTSKKWLRFLLILLPVGLILAQIFWQPPRDRLEKIKTAVRALIPPIEIVFQYFNFNEKNALTQWEDKTFQGRSAYWIDFQKKDGFVHSKSEQAASAIFYRIKFKTSEFPFISWNWRIGKFPDKSKAVDPKKRDDFAARLYVVFISHFFTNFRCLEYVWDESVSEGTILESPYSDQIKQIVVQSGASKSGEWVSERQNILEDYKKLFGEEPKMKVGAIALMTDSEGTEGEAEGFFDDIQIGKANL